VRAEVPLLFCAISHSCYSKILDLDPRSLDDSGNPALVEDNDDVQNQNEWSYNLFINSICEAGRDIDSIDMPLFGNRAAYCALPTFPCIVHPMTLKVLCLTMVSVPEDEAFYDWIYRCQALEALQLSFSMCPKNQPPAYLPPDGYHGIMPGWWPSHSDFRLISLKTFQLMSDNQYSFAVEDICQFLSMFPNISELAFAHIMLAEGTWKDFLERLQSLNLEKLFLLSPRDIITTDDFQPIWPATKYEADQHTKNAAKEVRLVHTESPTELNGQPMKTTTFEYPGFAIFE
jgi:hypothetical protein